MVIILIEKVNFGLFLNKSGLIIFITFNKV